jgi:putative resolvase
LTFNLHQATLPLVLEPILLTPLQIRRLYGLHPNTLLKWERHGLIRPLRTPGGRRRYRREDVEALLGLEEARRLAPQVVLYARVSTRKQEAYLQNQIVRLEAWAKENNLRYEVVAEVAGGVNEKRRGLLKVLNRVKRGEVEAVVVEYEDRLARFGVDYLRAYLEAFGARLVVLNGEEHPEDLRRVLSGGPGGHRFLLRRQGVRQTGLGLTEAGGEEGTCRGSLNSL